MKAAEILKELEEAYKRVTGTDDKSQFPDIYTQLSIQRMFYRLDEIERELELAAGRAK